jgi:hypothetical protein
MGVSGGAPHALACTALLSGLVAAAASASPAPYPLRASATTSRLSFLRSSLARLPFPEHGADILNPLSARNSQRNHHGQ